MTATDAPSMLVAPGETIAGKYLVEGEIGAGAMGVVLSAKHLALGERVAIKCLRSEYAENPEIVARFLREAQAAARIRNEHIARVSDIGILETGAPYLVMEYLTGMDLGQRLQEHGPLEIDFAIEAFSQVCVALAEAHAIGIVHRDIKPSNVFLSDRRNGSVLVKVLDFGVAKSMNESSSLALTAMGQVVGSPSYMSPEQLSGSRDIDGRSDVWQLGLLLYEMLTGESAFGGKSIADVVLAIQHGDPPLLRDRRSDAPATLENLILLCLAKEREHRPQTVAAVARAVEPLTVSPRARVCLEQAVVVFDGAPPSHSTPRMRKPIPSPLGPLATTAAGPAGMARTLSDTIQTNAPMMATQSSPRKRVRKLWTDKPSAQLVVALALFAMALVMAFFAGKRVGHSGAVREAEADVPCAR